VIDSFSGPNRFLSNFVTVPHRVRLGREMYPSVDPIERQKVRECNTAGQAKRMGRRVTKRDDWESIRIGVMKDLLRQKFGDEPFRSQLLATGTQELIEGNTWNDVFWGVCDGEGENWLGKLLMEVRAELRG
jgi:ribA/ribD-fused uncharacterized protein